MEGGDKSAISEKNILFIQFLSQRLLEPKLSIRKCHEDNPNNEMQYVRLDKNFSTTFYINESSKGPIMMKSYFITIFYF